VGQPPKGLSDARRPSLVLILRLPSPVAHPALPAYWERQSANDLANLRQQIRQRGQANCNRNTDSQLMLD
jgi:hypothetical protein